jgi:hypothetical protein
MANIAGKAGLKILTIMIGIPAGIAAKKLVERAWLTARPDDPPRKPSEPYARWQDVVGWAALSAAGVVTADYISRRGAEATWRVVMGSEPPPTKEQKKAIEKSQEKARL